MRARLRPYLLQISLGLYCPLLLWADSRIATAQQQWLLGGLTFATLYIASRASPIHERRQIWLCVVIATGFEIWGSMVWGLYRYRWHTVPLFVPPGHGMVYLFGLTAARTPLLLAHRQLVTRLALVAASGWAVAGLTFLPALTGRTDVTGALLLPVFAWFMLRSPRAPVFAGIFVATTGLELFGTNFGNWMWLAHSPWTSLPTGNPPSVIAGGYCIIDGTVMLATRLLARVPALGHIRLTLPAHTEPELQEAAA